MVEDGGRVGVVEDTLDFTERLNNLKASFNKLGIEVALNENREWNLKKIFIIINTNEF